jgi:hypothetical protein
VERMNSSMIYLICCKNLCECYNVPSPSTTKEKKKTLKEKKGHSILIIGTIHQEEITLVNYMELMLVHPTSLNKNYWT